MELRALGRTGIHVSVLGLGTVKLGRNRGVKYPTRDELPTDVQIDELLCSAEELGVNVLDTAPAYGSSEARLGQALARVAGRSGSRNRDRWVLITKAGEAFDGERSHFDFAPAALRASVERSLKLLGTERLDVVLLHSDGVIELDPRRDEAMGALQELRTAGKVRAVGASTKSVEGGLWAVQSGDVVMVTLNDQEREGVSVIDAARACGAGVLVKKPLGSGLLAPETSIAGAAATPGVSSVIVGTLRREHLQRNAEIAARTHQAGPSPSPRPIN